MIVDKSQTASTVSADFDRIIEFFEDLNIYLNRLKVLERQVRRIPELEVTLAGVLKYVLVLCGICAKYVKMNRIGNWSFSVLLLKLALPQCFSLNYMLVFLRYFTTSTCLSESA